MSKDVESQNNVQHSLYPMQMPSAPPSYDEVVLGPQVNSLYPTQPTTTVFNQTHSNPGAYIPSAGIYVQPSSIVEIQRTVVALPLGPNPANIKCPSCNCNILTSVDSEPNCAAHLCCLLLFMIGCCPFSSLPYCVDALKNVRHSCPNCKTFLGYYQP